MQAKPKEVFDLMAEAVDIANVRHAVVGLEPGSVLEGFVETYGQRSNVVPGSLAFQKQPTTKKEQIIWQASMDYFRNLGIGGRKLHTKKGFIFLPSLNSGSDGIVERLQGVNIGYCREVIGQKPVRFFINSPQAVDWAERNGFTYIGSDAATTIQGNSKAWQRQAVDGDFDIFPPNIIVQTPDQARKAFWIISAFNSGVLAKAPHLASGESFQTIENPDQAVLYLEKWSRIMDAHGFKQEVIIEQKILCKSKHFSTSALFYRQGKKLLLLGTSVQHVTADGFGHKGNKVGTDIRSQLSSDDEAKMIRLALKAIKKPKYAKFQGLIGFDFILYADGRVRMTEVNLRFPASALLFALQAQLGGRLSYDMQKIEVEPNKISAWDFLQKLSRMNSSESIFVPLNMTAYEKYKKLFLVICAPTFVEINSLRERIKSWFG